MDILLLILIIEAIILLPLLIIIAGIAAYKLIFDLWTTITLYEMFK